MRTEISRDDTDPYQHADMEPFPVYLMHDQPMCCPICGQRTNWIGEEPQLHECICGYRFLLYEDEDLGLVELDDGWIFEIKLI